jgi:hypothetical protein
MLSRYARHFLMIGGSLRGAQVSYQITGAARAMNPDSAASTKEVSEALAGGLEVIGLLAAADEMDLVSVRAQIRRLNEMLRKQASDENIEREIASLFERIKDELENRKFLYVPESSLYEAAAPYGPEVAAAFPKTSEDIEEAGKCLALGRCTACVFHLMRAMEVVVTRLGDKLGVTIVDKNDIGLDWGIILSNMKKPLDAMTKGPIKTSWSEAYALLFHVKEAWRNDTMHPKATYTPEQARDVFNAVRTFMKKLAKLV